MENSHTNHTDSPTALHPAADATQTPERHPLVQLNHVSKRFGTLMAVNDATFALYEGEVVGFVGANGAGKTTAISIIMGFIGASSGQTTIFDHSVLPTSAHLVHDKIGYAAGDMELPAQLTGRQYLDFLLHQYQGEHEETYQALIERFSPQLDKKIHDLSRGNRQKIALVAAFITDPKVIILDEPTSGLDPHMQETFLDLVRQRAAAGTTIFMSSHYLQEVVDVCDRVILMKNGRIVEDTPTKELLSRSGKRVTVRTAHAQPLAPEEAESLETSNDGNGYTMTFIYRADAPRLQHWLSTVEQLQDIEISEVDLETLFHDLYDSEVVEEEEEEAA